MSARDVVGRLVAIAIVSYCVIMDTFARSTSQASVLGNDTIEIAKLDRFGAFGYVGTLGYITVDGKEHVALSTSPSENVRKVFVIDNIRRPRALPPSFSKLFRYSDVQSAGGWNPNAGFVEKYEVNPFEDKRFERKIAFSFETNAPEETPVTFNKSEYGCFYSPAIVRINDGPEFNIIIDDKDSRNGQIHTHCSLPGPGAEDEVGEPFCSIDSEYLFRDFARYAVSEDRLYVIACGYLISIPYRIDAQAIKSSPFATPGDKIRLYWGKVNASIRQLDTTDDIAVLWPRIHDEKVRLARGLLKYASCGVKLGSGACPP